MCLNFRRRTLSEIAILHNIGRFYTSVPFNCENCIRCIVGGVGRPFYNFATLAWNRLSFLQMAFVLENLIAYGMQCCIYRGSLVCWVNLRATFLCKFFYVSNDISHHHFHLMLQYHLWPPPRYCIVCVCNPFWRVMTSFGSLIRPRIIVLQTKLIGVLTNAPPACSCDAQSLCPLCLSVYI